MGDKQNTTMISGDREIEIDLLELAGYFLSRWYLLLLGLIAGMTIAGVYTWFFITPRFSATSKLYMVSSSSDTIVDLTDFNIGNSLSSDYEELLKVRPILEEIIEEEDLPYSYEQILGMINISTKSNTRILQIRATSASPEEAMVIANALADKAVEEIPILMDTARPNIAERAIVPTQKSSPSMKRNVLVGGLLGLLLVAGVLTVLFLMDDTMFTAEDVQKQLGIMPLTVIPEGDIQHRYDTHEDKKGRGRRKSRDKERGQYYRGTSHSPSKQTEKTDE